MSPEIIGIIIGVVIVVPTIYIARKSDSEEWVWPVFLVTLPLYYMVFGFLVMDSKAILLELLFGLPYILIGLLVWKFKFSSARILIAIAWLSHGFYDYYHDFLFVNSGVFSWYPAFCALVDIIVGSYLLVNGWRPMHGFGKSSDV
ncbi:MAG: hypothetical protein V7721_07790 [Porticoccaceae bacterium]